MKDRKCLLIFVAISCFYVKYNVAQIGTSCQTPNGKTAKCISIFDCPLFIEAVQEKTHSQIEFLKQSQCGWENRHFPLICCGTSMSPETRSDKPVFLIKRLSSTKFKKNPLIPDRIACGIQEPDKEVGGFIFGGSETQIDEFPWLALLGYTSKNGTRRWDCGGTLINERYILTAAHCVVGTNSVNVVKLGEYNTDSDLDCDSKHVCSRAIVVDIAEITVPFEYEKYPYSGYDIALIRLSKKITYSNFIRPICLPEPNETSIEGEYLTTAGWGQSKEGQLSPIKLKVEIPIFNYKKCYRIFTAHGVTLGSSQICAGGRRGKDTCMGDSGGPLMKRSEANELQWYQEGIVSFGLKYCGKEGVPGVYIRVADFLPWIHSTVRR